jgi:hypothetical protein
MHIQPDMTIDMTAIQSESEFGWRCWGLHMGTRPISAPASLCSFFFLYLALLLSIKVFIQVLIFISQCISD